MRLRTRTALALTSIALVTGTITATSATAQQPPTNPAPAVTERTPLGPCNYNGAHPTIRRGSTGAAVSHAQCLLRSVWGYGSVAIDGIFGPKTENAVRDMQRRCGIAIDGIVGPNTWNCLHP